MDILTETANMADLPAKIRQEGSYVVGVKQLKKALRSGTAVQVFLARNADPRMTEDLVQMCEQCQVPFIWVPDMLDLGKACGISVGAAAAAAIRS